MSVKWLTSLVRARQLQEDSAKAQVATAQRISRSAHARVRYDAERIDSLVAADAQDSAPAFVAAAVALQAAAATHAAAGRHEARGRSLSAAAPRPAGVRRASRSGGAAHARACDGHPDRIGTRN